ncbi:MAG TPA: PDZ domain-containing protein [Candidatus Dormibacteraeota bacterium]|nr:PDZ domain-containing protein [Candidatus Dormibacteraeota bacterium]
MRKHLMISVALMPLLLTFSHAAQKWSYDQNTGQPWVFGGEDSEKSSYLGVDIVDVTSERLGILKLKEEQGVEVTMVDQDAPAGKAGIKEHDVILTMNGTTIESGVQLRRMIHETPPGRMISLGLSRDGQPVTVKVQLADKHKEFAWAGPKPDIHINIPEIHVPDIDIPSMNMVVVTSSARSGLMVENITQQLGDFFGVKNGNGVLVRSVEKGSRAEKAGFRAGDVIVKINDQSVHDISDFSHAVKSRSGNSVNVGVVRDKKEQTLSLSLPERKEQSDLLEDDSFDAEPLIQAETALDLRGVESEMARLRPQMELAIETTRKNFEKVRKEVCTQQKEILKQTEVQRQQFRKDMEHMREQLLKMSADWL